MHTLGRIGTLLVLGGFVIDFAVWLTDVEHAPFRWEPFSALLLPVGMVLLLISFIGLSKKTNVRADCGLSSSKSQSEVPPVSLPRQLSQLITVFSAPPVLFATVLILLGVVSYSGSYYWMTTRTFLPLKIAVSLSRGHIKTGDFYINLKGRYSVDLAVDYPFYNNHSCRLDTPNSVLKTHLAVSQNGRLLSETNVADYDNLGSFYATKSEFYNLDIDVLSDASCLNAGHPHIMVEIVWYDYDSYVTAYKTFHWLGLFVVLVGLTVLFRSAVGQPSKELRADELVVVQPSHSGFYQPHRRLPPPKRLISIPSFGLLLVLVLSLALCSIAIVQSIFSPIPARGFWVSIPRQYPGAPAQVSLEGKIVLQIDAQNRWYLNSREISPAELPGALQKALAQRPDWVVYLDASPEIDYKHAVSAMSIIRDAHAQIVLITPRMKGSAR